MQLQLLVFHFAVQPRCVVLQRVRLVLHLQGGALELVLLQVLEEVRVARGFVLENEQLFPSPLVLAYVLDDTVLDTKHDFMLIGTRSANKYSVSEGDIIREVLLAVNAVLVEGIRLDHPDQLSLDKLLLRVIDVRRLERVRHGLRDVLRQGWVGDFFALSL